MPIKKILKYVSSALLRGEPIGLECDFKIDGKLPENVDFEIHETGFTISPYLKKPFKNYPQFSSEVYKFRSWM